MLAPPSSRSSRLICCTISSINAFKAPFGRRLPPNLRKFQIADTVDYCAFIFPCGVGNGVGTRWPASPFGFNSPLYELVKHFAMFGGQRSVGEEKIAQGPRMT